MFTQCKKNMSGKCGTLSSGTLGIGSDELEISDAAAD